MEPQSLPTNINEARTGFKRRQYTSWFSGMYILFAIAMVTFSIIMYSIQGKSWLLIVYPCVAVLFLVFSLVKFFISISVTECQYAFITIHILFKQAMVYCDVEDLGASLSVRFGPYPALLCGVGDIEIPYRDIKLYHEPTNTCEGCCAYGVGKINKCTKPPIRQHALCSCCCKQRQMVIVYRNPQMLCMAEYSKIVIAVNGEDFHKFKTMLDEKFNVITTTTPI